MVAFHAVATLTSQQVLSVIRIRDSASAKCLLLGCAVPPALQTTGTTMAAVRSACAAISEQCWGRCVTAVQDSVCARETSWASAVTHVLTISLI